MYAIRLEFEDIPAPTKDQKGPERAVNGFDHEPSMGHIPIFDIRDIPIDQADKESSGPPKSYRY